MVQVLSSPSYFQIFLSSCYLPILSLTSATTPGCSRKKKNGCLRFLEPRYWPLGIIGDHDPKYGWYLRISSNKWTHRRILDFGLCFWPRLCQNEFHLKYSCKQWAGWKKTARSPRKWKNSSPIFWWSRVLCFLFSPHRLGPILVGLGPGRNPCNFHHFSSPHFRIDSEQKMGDFPTMAVQNHVVKHHQTQLANCDDPKDDPPSRLLTLQAMFSPKWVYLKMGYTSPFMICIYIYMCDMYILYQFEVGKCTQQKKRKNCRRWVFPVNSGKRFPPHFFPRCPTETKSQGLAVFLFHGKFLLLLVLLLLLTHWPH